MKQHLFKTIIYMLITFLLISVSLSIADDKKVKSSESTKQEEDIQPPSGEMWYEEGDEEIYKFDIEQITPRKGIMDGLLIFFGHYIKPPYKTSILYQLGTYSFQNKCYIYINGINLNHFEYDFQKKYFEHSRKKRLKGEKISADIIKAIKKEELLRDTLLKFQNKLINDFNLKQDSKQDKAINELKEYLNGIEDIISFKIYSAFYFEVELSKSTFLVIKNEDFNPPWDPYIPPSKEECLAKATSFEENIRNLNNISFFETSNTITLKDLLSISNILNTTRSREVKIKEIYKLVGNINDAKFLYYNFEYKNYLKINNTKGQE